MKSATIRWIVILALITSAGIIVIQTYWVRKALQLEEKEFNLNVLGALRDVAAQVMQHGGTQVPLYSPVTRVSPEYYIVQTNVFVEKDVLQHYLVSAFDSSNIITDFAYGLYDCMTDTVQYQGYYHMHGSGEKSSKSLEFPRLKKRENYYFGVYFPNRKAYLTSQISVWVISSVVLICVLLFLGYLLFIIFKQKRLSEIQKDFLDSMAHEFKTPLSSIQLSSEVLKNPGIANNPQRLINYATIISNEAVKLIAQVDLVLQMAQANKSRIILHKERFVWQDLLKQATTPFQENIRSTGGKILLHVPEEPFHYYGDVLHLKNTISNLIDNALKYCEQDPQIDITLKKDQHHYIVTIRDNGIGIDRQHQKFLFDKFYRVPTGNVYNVKGFGLGLYYVRLIARAHGGDVKCNSEPGKGSIFILTFPNKT